MKKGVLLLIFLMIFTMIIPAQALEVPQKQLNELPSLNDVNGKYVVSVKVSDEWNNIGSLEFGKNTNEQAINLGGYLSYNTIIKLSQDGGGAAYLDAVLLDGQPAVKANENDEKVLGKLFKEDLDITPVGEEGVVLEFCKCVSGVLTVVGRIESEVISKEPLQFPAENNYKSKDQVEDFYPYTLDSNKGTIKVDGILEEVNNIEPFVKEYRVPGSGHPAGDTYFWVMNDNKNLYVTMDVTPDNTFDGDKDYAKVYITTDEGIKEFKISVLENTWGNTEFTYTDKIGYEHKTYEFSIPLTEINYTGQINLAFVIYGTVSLYEGYHNPALAYDPGSDVYICVSEYVFKDSINPSIKYSHIYGELVDKKGKPIPETKVAISENYLGNENTAHFLYTPDITYSGSPGEFLVVWNQNYSLICASTISISKNNDGKFIYNIGEPFIVSSYDEDYHNVSNPIIAFDKNNNQYLAVWEENYYEKIEDNNVERRSIRGQFINSDFTLLGEPFDISDKDGTEEIDPSICYSDVHKCFLIVWEYNGESHRIQSRAVKSKDKLSAIENLTIFNRCGSPDVEISENYFFVTYTNQILDDFGYSKSVIYGQYVNVTSSMLIETIIGEFKVSPDNEPDDYNNYYLESPASYYDGDKSMLCVWGSAIADDPNSYARLSYVDDDRNVGATFYTDELEDNRDSIKLYNTRIAITGNNNGNNLIAYELKGSSDLGYRLFKNEPSIAPYIDFSNTPFEDIVVGNTLQVKVKLFNNEFPNGTEINENLFYFIENDQVASIDNKGLITGCKENITFVNVIYDPWAKIEDNKVSFSDAMIITKKPATVKVISKLEPSLNFDKNLYSVTLNKTIPFSVILNNYNDQKQMQVTDIVMYQLGDTTKANISTSGAITGLAVGTTTVSAIYTNGEIELEALATINVIEQITPPPPSSGGGSSLPIKTPIGEILVNNKVIKTLYEEDVKAENNVYTFIANNEGDTAKLWLNSNFYEGLAKDYPNRIIKFNWENGTYTLPLNCDEVLDELDSAAKRVDISIEKVDNKETISSANESAVKMGADIVSDFIDFSIIVEKGKQNTEIESLDFYAERTINNLDNISEEISTAMKFVKDKEYLTFAPSVFDKDYATIKYRGNGIFTIIENPQTFNDIANHWSRLNIEKLATRNIAFGRENNNFEPQDFVTRAEFAVMITRALGITEEEGSNDFKDISNEWFAEDISTAFKAGLISGRNGGNFYPNEKVKRQDMAVMIQNALKFVGLIPDVSNAESVLFMFNDKNAISDYARESVAVCAEAGIIMGRDNKNFDPNDNATRAEASAIIERMLRYLDFMN